MAVSVSVVSVILLLLLGWVYGQGEIGFLLPCGEDNFSCPRIGNLSQIPLQCYSRAELCDGVEFCNGGSDEGRNATIVSLECENGVCVGRVCCELFLTVQVFLRDQRTLCLCVRQEMMC